MPQPLTPTSSQEIIAISPPAKHKPAKGHPTPTPLDLKPKLASASKTLSHMSNYASTSTSRKSSSAQSTTLPTPHTFQPSPELKGKIVQHVRADKYLQQIGEVDTPGDPKRSRSPAEAAGAGAEGQRGTKRKLRQDETAKERVRLDDLGMSRERVTQRMVRPSHLFILASLCVVEARC